MKSRHVFYTRRLARLYLDQGYLDDAENAFRALSVENPGCEECRAGLSAVARRKKEMKKDDLAGLVKVWVDLLRKEKYRGRSNG